ncbi:MAG: TRAP transporter small permease [Deferrisomatales bacterium]|nr:TRAP transporter small permease [Deferrisomatales bacterium]
MEILSGLRRAVRATTYGLSFAGMFALLPLMLLTSAEVVGRAAWSRPIPGAVELSSYLLAVFVLLGIGYTQQVKGHVRVEMLTSRLPARGAAALQIFTTVLSLGIVGVLAWQGWVLGMEERAVSDMLRVPQKPFRLLVAVAGAALFLELLLDLAEATARLVRR